jgi:flagellar motor switch/type III secretory pathway protein FliN
METSRLTKLTIQASVCLGKQRIKLKDLCQLMPGAIISFDEPCGDAELMVNGCTLGTGGAVSRGSQIGFRVNRIVAKPE